MWKFARNKTVGVRIGEGKTLAARGVLDDGLYSLSVEVRYSIPELEIISLEGEFYRWTTPECPKAKPALQRAVGMRVGQEDFQRTIKRDIGTYGCQHFADLILDCSDSARELAMIMAWREAGGEESGKEIEDFADAVWSGEAIKKPQAPPKKAKPKPRAKGPKTARAGDGGFLIDLHIHTSPASSCSSLPVEELIARAGELGLDGICLTDHNYQWPAEEVAALNKNSGLLILGGTEITTDRGDVLVFGLDKQIDGIITLPELRELVDKAGGYMIAAHPFRGFLAVGVGSLGMEPETAAQTPMVQAVDALEALNGKVGPDENDFAAKVAKFTGKPATGGSDAHSVEEVGLYATRFEKAIHNEAELIEALKSGKYQAVAYRGRMED